MLHDIEARIILRYLHMRTIVAIVLSFISFGVLWVLLKELSGDDANAALTALLGAIAGFLGNSLLTVIQAISAPILDYLKDRLGTVGPPAES